MYWTVLARFSTVRPCSRLIGNPFTLTLGNKRVITWRLTQGTPGENLRKTKNKTRKAWRKRGEILGKTCENPGALGNKKKENQGKPENPQGN